MGKLTRGRARRLLSVLLAMLLLAAAMPQPGAALAADVSIPCTGGVGDVAALVAAIAAANGNGQSDTIRLGGTPAQPCTYTLTAPHNTTGGANGLPTIRADKGHRLTIVGNGATIRRAPEARPFRLLYVEGGALTLRDLTLAGGVAVGGSGEGSGAGRTGGFGGAIFNAGQLALEGVTVTASEARGGDGASRAARDSGGGGGGGAGLGGAIFNAATGSLTLVNSTLSGNTARGGQGGAGGGSGDGYVGGGGGGQGGGGGGSPPSARQPGRAGGAALGFGGGGGGGGGSNGSASDPFAPGNPRAGAGGAGSYGGGGGGAGASRLGGSGNTGGPGGFGAGAGGTSCCGQAGGGGGGAGLGGAIFNSGGAVTISYSTVTANLGRGGAGGPGSSGFGDGRPGSGQGGAIFTRGGTVSYGGSILAGNGAADCAASDAGALVSQGFNMLAPAGGCGGGASDRLAADPGLEALANNGGPSPTHALTAGSLALDGGGGPACPAADQRGVARPQGAACDSGAFEREAGPAALVVTTAADSGEGSLRAAIEAANARPGPDMIGFAIAGSPVITPASPLPPLTGPTAIEGLTQPGATALAPTVTLDGGLLADDADGLVLVGGASSVQGLIITGFGGAGISVPAGEGATLRGNRFSRNGLAIDLGADGPTPNGLALDVEEAEGGILIAGGLDAAPGVYTVDLYASATCRLADGGEGASPRLSGPGDGETLLGTVAAAAGAPFSLSVADPALAGTWISAIATDAAGNTSEFSACAPIRANDLWTNALPIELLPTGAPGGAEGAASQSISRPYQERWYRFPVGPGGRVRVELAGAPGSILTLHRDLERVYGQLSRPQSAELLAADEQTTGFLPGAYLPGAYLPGAYLPGAYLPGAYLPGAYLPGAYLPGAYLPGAYLPGAYLPGAYLPGAYLPGAYLPGAYLPEQYAAAARASLMAFAADPAADRLTIERNTWDLAENLYVRVVAPEGTDFAVAVSFQGGICSDIRAPDAGLPTIAGGPIAPDTFQTLILWDAASVPDADEPVLLADLAAFAGRPEVDGLLVNLSQPAAGGPRFPRAAAARATLAANTSCVAAANLLAGEIKAVADAHRAAYPGLRYIVLVGGDEAIPFFRYPDVAGLANESEYFPPVEELSAANAALREGRVSGQDAYGTSTFIRRGAYELPVPDLAVGRLVGDAATVRGMLAAYAGAAGLVSPRSALVSGYDFVADGAEAVFADLQAGLSAPGGPTVAPERLIQPEGLGPDDPSAWSADDLRARLLDPAVRNDMVFFTGHFAAGSALAADYATSLLASEVAESGADFTNTILFGLGCHSGYNVPAPGAIPGFSPEPDWPAAWARAGATYIAATGFAYGDTELVEYGERLLLNISQAMRTGDGPVAVGEAVVRAKQDYLAQKAALSGIDEKTLLQFVLYGLPMLQVDLPGKLTAPGAPQLVDGVRDVTAGTPGAALGLRVGTSGGSEIVTVNSSPLRRSLTLTDTDGSRVEAVYYEGPGGAVVANPTEPLLPLERREVDVSGPGGPQVLRGVGFRGGAFEERAELALTSAPATENARGFLKFLGDTFYPSQPWSANHLDALRGGAARLMVVPAQYRAEPGGASAYRVFSSMQFKLFYLDADWPASDRRAAGLAPAPEIAQVASERLPDGRVAFSAFVVNGAAGVAGSRLGVQEVWVTYSEPGSGRWESVDLRPDPADPTRWVGPAGGVSLADGTAFMVQAAGAAGKVSLDTNSGAYYTVPPLVPGEPPGAPRDTAIVAVALPASGAYGARVGFTVRLVDGGGAALSGRGLRLFLGGQVALATTDAAGQAGFALDLAQPPGAYPLLVTYGGEAGYRSARLTGAFTIVPAATTLALAPAGSVTTVTGAPTGLVATLRTAAGGPIADATVLFVAEGAGGPLGAAAKTNLDGRAVLGSVPWPDGSYTVTAYFAGNGSPPTGGPANPASPYLPSQSAGVALTINPAPPPETTITAGPEGFVALGAEVTISFAGSGGRPRLSFECRLNGAPFAPCASPLTLAGLAEGAYTFEVRAVDVRGVADPTPAAISWRVVDWAKLYRARQVGNQVWIERNVAEAGLGDFDSGPSDGWAIVGRTNGEADDGDLRGFFVEGGGPFGTPYAIIFNRSPTRGDRCILVTPVLMDRVLEGQSRPLRIVEVLGACPAP